MCVCLMSWLALAVDPHHLLQWLVDRVQPPAPAEARQEDHDLLGLGADLGRTPDQVACLEDPMDRILQV